jgi:hypothetical protein
MYGMVDDTFRVDKMLSSGLIDELVDFRYQMLQHSSSLDRTDVHMHGTQKGDGIFNIIGLKEFGPFLDELEAFVTRTSHCADVRLSMKAVASELLTYLDSNSVKDTPQSTSPRGGHTDAQSFIVRMPTSECEHSGYLLPHLKSAVEKVFTCYFKYYIIC